MKPTISAAVKIFGLVAVCLTAIGASIATAHRAASYVRGTAVPATAKDDGQKTSSAASAILTASSSFATGGVDEVRPFSSLSEVESTWGKFCALVLFEVMSVSSSAYSNEPLASVYWYGCGNAPYRFRAPQFACPRRTRALNATQSKKV